MGVPEPSRLTVSLSVTLVYLFVVLCSSNLVSWNAQNVRNNKEGAYAVELSKIKSEITEICL
jgi:hypothetical protein